VSGIMMLRQQHNILQVSRLPTFLTSFSKSYFTDSGLYYCFDFAASTDGRSASAGRKVRTPQSRKSG
jgi:hypothetical protein